MIIDVVYTKLVKFIGMFYKLRNRLPHTVLRTLYFAFVHLHIAYGIKLYANTAVTHLNKLLILNNKLLRILQNKPYNYPSNELYTAYKTLSIPDLHIQQILLLVHKFVHHKYRLPITFVDYFDFNRNIHGHNTRGSNDLHVISVNKNFGKRSIKHKASMLWNQLPNELKQFLSIRTFADRVKIFLQSAGNMTEQ